MSELIKLNDREYTVNCAFINASPYKANKQPVDSITTIPYGMFEHLEITDSIYSPFLRAKAIIKNTNNLFEKDYLQKDGFRFGAGSRNTVFITLQPTDVSNVSINFIGVINECVNMSADDSSSTAMILDLIDTKQAALLERKVANTFTKIIPGKTVGENIQELLKNVHPTTKQLFSNEFNPGNLKIDTGYTFPLHYNLYDALKFLLRYNIGEFDQIPTQLMLRYDNDQSKQSYSNTSLFELFKNATQSQSNTETFLLGSQNTNLVDDTKNSNNRSKINNSTFIPQQNILTNTTFANVNFNVSNKDLVNIYHTDTTNADSLRGMGFISLLNEIKQFEKTVLNTREMKQIYSNGAIVVNVDVDTNISAFQNNYKIISSPFGSIVNEKVAKVQLYNSFIFENMSLSFKTYGQVYRNPGHFINICKYGDTNNPYDERIIGQWLVTEVNHIFTKGTYMNTIQCVKPFRIET